MKAVLIGVGQAGGRIAQALADYDSSAGFGAVQDVLAVNTADLDLQPLTVDTLLIGQARVKGHGVGGDNELGAAVMQDEATEVVEALNGTVTAATEAIFVIAGLGGGTGSGGAPALTQVLQRVYDLPVYGLAILPGRHESSMEHANAGRSLKTFVREADALLLVDNDAWRSEGESVEGAHAAINERIARRVGVLLASGETVAGVGESVVDSSEIINTLAGGGMAALGYASAKASQESAENTTTIGSLVRNALLSDLSLPDATDAESALLVVAGRPSAIPRKGIERARRWLEEETGSLEVRGGDFPLEDDRLAALVLVAGIQRSQQVDAFLDRASAALEAADESRDDPAEAFQNEELDDLI